MSFYYIYLLHMQALKKALDWWSGLFLLYNSSQCLAICNVLALATTSCSVQYCYESMVIYWDDRRIHCCSPNLLCRACNCLFFTLLKFRFNTRWLLLFFSPFFCRYFYNSRFRLQELTWVEIWLKFFISLVPQSQSTFIALFVYLSFALSSLFPPKKCVVLF